MASAEDFHTKILIVMNIREFEMTTNLFRKGCSCWCVTIDQGLSEYVMNRGQPRYEQTV